MKALTLTQPWATLVAVGKKKIETRSWTTEYRGPLAIHAAKGFPEWARETCLREPFSDALNQKGISGPSRLPVGCVLCIVELVNVEKITMFAEIPTDPEFSFGDYSTGRYMWHMRFIRRITPPIVARGALSLWDWVESGTATPRPLAGEGSGEK